MTDEVLHQLCALVRFVIAWFTDDDDDDEQKHQPTDQPFRFDTGPGFDAGKWK